MSDCICHRCHSLVDTVTAFALSRDGLTHYEDGLSGDLILCSRCGTLQFLRQMKKKNLVTVIVPKSIRMVLAGLSLKV